MDTRCIVSDTPSRQGRSRPVLTARLQSTGENAVQIIPPHDAGIAESIDESLEVDEAAWKTLEDENEWTGTEEMKSAYLKMSSSLATSPA